jgi:hypothetical protein
MEINSYFLLLLAHFDGVFFRKLNFRKGGACQNESGVYKNDFILNKITNSLGK